MRTRVREALGKRGMDIGALWDDIVYILYDVPCNRVMQNTGLMILE